MHANSLRKVLSRQFYHSWNLLYQLIENCRDDLWFQVEKNNDKEYWIYSLTVFHILETTVYYYRSSPKGMKWGVKGNIDWKEKKPVEEKIVFLTKRLLIDYLSEIEQMTKSIFEDKGSQLLETDEFHWFPTRVDKYLYLLRHNLMHIGELNKAQRDNKNPRLQWE
ncbi:MAG: hypothetical protein ACW97P_03605 [Candidatus Hodarchaeales archaeon]